MSAATSGPAAGSPDPTGTAAASPAALPAPIVRRLLAMAYESMLLFGVVFGTGMVYGIATNQRHALQGRSGLAATLFLVLAAYFIGFWLAGGQTLAMKTWHLRVQRVDGHPLRPWQAMARFLMAWAWLLPPLAIVAVLRLKGVGAAYVVTLLLWTMGYAALALRHPRRQFLHDALCGTELVDIRPAARTR